MNLLRKLYSWYRPLYIETTILTIEKKHHGPYINLLSFEVNYGGYRKFGFTSFALVASWRSHFAFTILGLNFRIVKMAIDNWQWWLQFLNKTLWTNAPGWRK